MEVIRDPGEMTQWSNRCIGAGRTIALVPTMGYFHDGHTSLMRLAGRHADRVVVSLFVNPIQFGPGEDLEVYPRDFPRDRDIAERAGVAVLFAPEARSMYPNGFLTGITVEKLTDGLCGSRRPGHFDGVTTVVGKLFHIVKPHCAVFGEKDYQQLAVIRKMTVDLNWDIDIIGHPIVREEDGLALSSRNKYLDAEMRRSALSLSKAIRLAQTRAREGIRSARQLESEISGFIHSHPGTAVEYVSFIDCHDLEEKEIIDNNTLLALAVTVGGKVRLIDNGMLFPGPSNKK